MCFNASPDPFSMGVSLIGSGLNAYTQNKQAREQGRQQQIALQNQAVEARNNARLAKLNARDHANAIDSQRKQHEGAIRGRLSKSGVVANSGTSLDLLAKNRANYAVDQLNALYQGERTANAYTRQAAQSMAHADSAWKGAKQQGAMSILSGFLGGAQAVAPQNSSFGDWKKSMGWQ
ncbi:MAG: hypothetical protein HQL50_13435 [Magnetococcales bacterium]|nr:hypothetical protein [Magnetococcales bacterium]